MNKEEIPGITRNKTISLDYWNEIQSRILLLEINEETLYFSFKKYGKIKYYQEYFSSDKFIGRDEHFKVNIQKINKINKIVDILNTFENKKITIIEFKRFAKKIRNLLDQ